jgi:hypothetical protein
LYLKEAFVKFAAASVFALLLSTPAFAGTWTCDTGLDGKIIYHMVAQGEENGHMNAQASVSVAGLPGGNLSLINDVPEKGELGRYIVGGEDPRSKTRLRIMFDQTAPNVFKAYSLLVNFAIKQEFEGTCTYAP